MRRLTNLSGNNRSLLLLKLHSEQLLDIQKLSFLNGEKAFEIINALIAGKSKKICPVLDSRMEATNDASKRLKRLQRLDKFIFEERGSNDLHVGWPMVRGKFLDGTLVRCPLLYFPVSINQENSTWYLSPREDAGITFNKSFLLAFEFYNKVKLSADLPDTSFEEFEADSTAFRTQLYDVLKDSVELNFNRDLFVDELIPFEEFKRDEFETQHNNGELKLFSEAVLGIFPQAGSQLVPDYNHLIERKSFSSLEEFFSAMTQSTDQQVDKWISSIREEKIYAPFSLDAYQEHALRICKDGRSLVVQGPPGTGKSQLIANLMADAIASRKKVLLVCQKRVALDVVYDRLAKIELGDFLGLVHDFRNDRKSIFEKIARQIDRIDDYKSKDRSVDIIQLERRFFHVCRTIDHLTETLEEFRTALFDENECGIGVKELYLTSDPRAESINLRQAYQHFNRSTIADFVVKLRRFVQYAQLLDREDHAWRNRKSFSQFQLGDLREIEDTVLAIPTVQREISEQLYNILAVSLNLDECESLLQRKGEVDRMLSLLANKTVFEYFRIIARELDDETNLPWLLNLEKVCLSFFDDAGVEATLASDQLVTAQLALDNYIASRKGLISRFQWMFSNQKTFLKRILFSNSLKFDKAGLEILERRIDNRLNLEHNLTAIKEKKWLVDVPLSQDLKEISKWFESQRNALEAKLIFNTLRELLESVNVQKISLADFRAKIDSILDIISRVPDYRKLWMNYLTPWQIKMLILKPELDRDWVKQLRNDFDKICEFDAMKESQLPHEHIVVEKLHEHVGDWDIQKMESLFENSVRLGWIEHIEIKYPVLRSVSTFKMSEMQLELQQSVKEKSKLSAEILLLRARERVYENIEYNRLNNRVTYRDLHHQVIKKKKIWPVRKVLAEFSNELFNLIPCWMASPESVSAIFPMEQLFDLVIFDEASQCFSERGIPAMFRGKQVLIAGDSKQLKPFELYQARWEGETESADLEVDSLLDLSERYLPTVQLQGHYRSQSLSLIDFSNQYFYGGKLKLLPDKKVVNKNIPAIDFKKVNGLWEDQTNVIEAQAVVQHAFDWIDQNRQKEIGIITFNAPQQMLILDLLEQHATTFGKRIPSTLFVKNIENVQGDERDVIIFSVGYAPDKDGKLNMQFGSLNLAGGENRLNVAVTRAREKVVVITSIHPEELKLHTVKNDGPKLLKKYLEHARDVSEGKFEIQEATANQYSSSWYLGKQLVKWSLQNKVISLSSNALPFTDLNVNADKNQVAVLLTDDQVYHTSLTAKEPHAYTPELLHEKGWTYLRVFSRNWWNDRENVETELHKFIYQVTEAR